jgi:Type III secretion needle MxiH, YscF, SsaG, EprI, PscF, EscF
MVGFGAAAVTGVSGGLDLGTINGTMNGLLTSSENSLNTLMTTIGSKDSPSITDMLSLQQGLQTWSVSVQASSTIVKDFFDSMKEVLQKA